MPRDNPFSTRYVRPGALPFLFGPGESLAGLADRLTDQGRWGQIVGPHGSGKSTLLAALVSELERRGCQLQAVRLNQRDHLLPSQMWEIAAQPGTQLLVIDGFEQMGFWLHRRLCRLCRYNGHGLLVTCHRDLGLPELYRTIVTPVLGRQVLDVLLTDKQRRVVEAFDLPRSLAEHRGNFREVLFALYDLYEEQTRCAGISSHQTAQKSF
jgi:hypothetical protein